MSSSTENRLSYASSPESDLEVSPPPAPRLVKSSSDPSIATTQDNIDRDDEINHMAEAVPPPYSQGGYSDSKYGFSANTAAANSGVNHASQNSHSLGPPSNDAPPYQCNPMTHSPPQSPLYGTVPELPPRGPASRPAGGVLLPAPPPSRPPHNLRHNPSTNRPSAQERLFGTGKEAGAGAAGSVGAGNEDVPTYSARPTSMVAPSQGSLDRHRLPNPQSSYDGTSSYEYSGGPAACAATPGSARLPPNAPDDLKVAPPPKQVEPPPPPNPSAMSSSPQRHSGAHDHPSLEYRPPDNYRTSDAYRSPQSRQPATNGGVQPASHARGPSLPNVLTNDHAKYSSRTNSASQADYGSRVGAPVPPYKPVPPPKPKHYRPPDNAYHPRNGEYVQQGAEQAAGAAPQSPRGPAPAGYPPQHYSHQHSLSQPSHRPGPHAHNNYHQNMYGGQMQPQSPPYSGPPSHHRAINLPHNPHLIDLAGSREQRGSAFELYRKPQHMHNISSSDALNSSIERDETFSPKTKKKLSKKPSFIKNAVLDLFRSKTKQSQKVSRQKSLCENDLNQRHNVQHAPMLRREKSDLSDMTVHMRNTQIRNQILQRSNSSSCEKSVLKPILKRQSSFCDERNGSICTVRDYDAKPIIKNLRRQNSLCEIETEPKVTPLLRRQNSLIEYNRRGIYGQTSFNMITKIDPIYQRQQQTKHEPFHPTQPLPPEPLYQSKEHIVYDPIPKPRRTYASLYDTSNENPYASKSEVFDQSIENPYGNHQTVAMAIIDPPYATRAECVKENPYAARKEMLKECPYATRSQLIAESPYGTRSDLVTESPYATRSEPVAENPYSSRNELLKDLPYATRNKTVTEIPYATKNELVTESPYAKRNELITDNPYETKSELAVGGLYGKKSEMLLESPYATRSELLTENQFSTRTELITHSQYNLTSEMIENPYATSNDLINERPYCTKHETSKRSDNLSGDSSYSTKCQMLRQRKSESPYATKEEMLRQRFSESPYNSAEDSLKQKFEDRKECQLGKRTYDPPPGTSWSDNSYEIMPERRLHTPINFPARFSPMGKCMSEPPYATRTEMMSRLKQTDSSYISQSEVNSACSDTLYSSRSEMIDARQEIRPASAECTYVSRQEILSQKATSRDNTSIYASKQSSYGIRLEEKLEIIKQRNQAKKDMIYQTRKEVNESDSMKMREPLYVSKRELKESVIYESHQETKEGTLSTAQEDNTRNSPYELSDANHLSRREPTYQSRSDAKTENEIFKEIDFSKLRLTDSKTDAEKEISMNLENNTLKGEPLYAPRMHGKSDHISNALKTTASPVPYESSTSMETQYASECSMNFENKPQSTPYASQDLDERLNKPNRTVTFCEKIDEKSPETSQDNSDNITITHNDTTVINNQVTIVQQSSQDNENKTDEVEPEGPHTTWGIFDSEGGVLEDRQWGVSLIIPPKAIAPGIKQKIYFTVTDPRLSQRVGGPPIDMDNGEAMLSPLVMCGPQGLVFLRPVTLRLPHCANAVPSLGLTIKATDTEAHLSTDWDQIHLPATTTLNTVAVKVDHF